MDKRYVSGVTFGNLFYFKMSMNIPFVSDYEMMVLMLVGSAFLWHQVRCLVAILLLVGQGHEQPEVMQQLLDIQSHPRSDIYLFLMICFVLLLL